MSAPSNRMVDQTTRQAAHITHSQPRSRSQLRSLTDPVTLKCSSAAPTLSHVLRLLPVSVQLCVEKLHEVYVASSCLQDAGPHKLHVKGYTV